MQGSDMLSNPNNPSLVTLDKSLIQPDRTHLLVQSAESLLNRTRHLGTQGLFDTIVQSSATCQWIVDLTYHIARCAYAGIARVHDKTWALAPIASAGQARVDSRQWWAHIQHALVTWRAELTTDTRPAPDPIMLRLPPQRTTSAKNSQRDRIVCVVPITVSGEPVAIFVVELLRSSSLVSNAEAVALVRAMANIATAALQAQVYGRAQTSHSTKTLRQAMARMQSALSEVSHELKSPLTTIMICLQLIGPKLERLAQLAPRSPDIEGTVKKIYEWLDLASRYAEIEDRIIMDLTDTSRIQSGKITLLQSLCDLGQVVQESVAGLRAVSSKRIIHLEAPDQSIPISADPDRVGQVVTNLLANALKYSPKERPVEVRIDVDKASARVSVHDSGPGLEKHELKRVWDRFYRASGAAACGTNGPGLGLGLYIAREIVRRHGGKVGAASAPGCGATFWFTLPLVPSPRAPMRGD
jgi:signal transduction histidine kinase